MKAVAWIKSHRYCLAGLYLFVFLAGFFLLEVIAPKPVIYIHCILDDWIPFNEWFVIPYFLWYAWVPVFMIYFMIHGREEYLQLCFIMFTGATFCLILYAVFPNGLQLRQEIQATNFCASLICWLRSIDPPCNVCPSIHVSSTVAIHLVIVKARQFRHCPRIRALSWVVTVLISISTLFIKQHSVIDVVCGWGLSLLLEVVWQYRERVWILQKRGIR